MPDTRYDADFYAWTQEQAALLRRMAEERINTRLDLEHLAEEVEGLGNNELAVVDGNLRQLIIHLLKLEWSPDPYPRRHWEEEAGNFRDNALERLERAPGVRRHIDLGTLYRRAAKAAGRYFAGLPEPVSPPVECPYTLDQLLDEDFFPVNRHGLP
ncbi:MAG TPA: DUF29 domain-containing protein [Azospirillum sp.]